MILGVEEFWRVSGMTGFDRSRGLYFGLVGMVWALASAVGPVLGGLFTVCIISPNCFGVC